MWDMIILKQQMHYYVTGFVEKGLERIIITVYLVNEWCIFYTILHQFI